jgi:hypothetical protein
MPERPGGDPASTVPRSRPHARSPLRLDGGGGRFLRAMTKRGAHCPRLRRAPALASRADPGPRARTASALAPFASASGAELQESRKNLRAGRLSGSMPAAPLSSGDGSRGRRARRLRVALRGHGTLHVRARDDRRAGLLVRRLRRRPPLARRRADAAGLGPRQRARAPHDGVPGSRRAARRRGGRIGRDVARPRRGSGGTTGATSSSRAAAIRGATWERVRCCGAPSSPARSIRTRYGASPRTTDGSSSTSAR